MSFFDDVPALSPVQFFGVTADCFSVRGALKADHNFMLPSTANLLGEESFADVYAGWNMDKMAFLFVVKSRFQKVVDADWRKGDSIEVFINTRDFRTSVSRFCHHFAFVPAQSQSFYGREVTRFRSDDMHPLCHPEDLQVTPHIEKNGYKIAVEIPAGCLHGYDPLSFSRIGFTYRINRVDGPPQHFAVSSEEYIIEQHPATWAALKLVRE